MCSKMLRIISGSLKKKKRMQTPVANSSLSAFGILADLIRAIEEAENELWRREI